MTWAARACAGSTGLNFMLWACRYAKKNSNARQLEITIPLSSCGTQGGQAYTPHTYSTHPTHPLGEGGGRQKRVERQTGRQRNSQRGK
jgi:hypothetical protein